MKRALLALAMAAGCSSHEVDARDGIPRSARSREVVVRVRPALEKRLSAAGYAWGCPVHLRIWKRERVLEVWLKAGARYRLWDTHAICALSGTLGPKLREGDRQAPEGFYEVPPTALNPASSYHLSMNIGYPNAFDRAHGRTGSAIMIHGNCASIGCFAMTDPVIESIYTLVEAALEAGQPSVPVHVFPWRPGALEPTPPTPEAAALWPQLRPAFDALERTGRPPLVRVKKDRYEIEPLESAP